MGVEHPGLGEQVDADLNEVRSREAEAGDNPIELGALKAVVSYGLLALVNLAWREEGSNGLDYPSEERSGTEQWVAGRVTTGLGQLLGLLRREPVRTWDVVGDLEACLGMLSEETQEEWAPEIVRLGKSEGLTVARETTSSGVASFSTPEGTITAYVYKARNPDVMLNGAQVVLVQRIERESRGFLARPPRLVNEYAVMVDDPYWGRRVQPAEFREGPYSESFVMGWRVKGRVLQGGEAVAGARVSLEGVTADAQGVETRFWDSLEFDELVWSDTLETWVQGATVYAPIMTDAAGRWEWLCPKGQGAIYQREGDWRDGTPETAAEGLARKLVRLYAVHRGRRVELQEEQEALLDLGSGRVEVIGEPGCWVKLGTLDEDGQAYLVPSEGSFTVTGLPEGEHNLVQMRRNAWGQWESSSGCARQTVVVPGGGTVGVNLGLMANYDPGANTISGRVYERPGVPAAGIAIVTISYENGQLGDPIATTDGGGYWEVEIPPEGLGGDPWIHDAQWGTVPLLGYPYSDVVLGARAYAACQEEYKPEVWRKGDRGHSNFQYLPGGIWVQDNVTGEAFGTTEAAYGGWVTEATLPKFRYVADLWELLMGGPQLREYSLWGAGGVLQSSFYLRSQSFSEYEDLPGQYRATGYWPEAKFPYGGKIKGSAVVGREHRIGTDLPEALRLGLEFGEHQWYVQVRAGTEGPTASCWADVVCPYCGGPAWRDPDGSGFVRGYCVQCAVAFENAVAMDCRTHFASPGLAARDEGYRLDTVRVRRQGGAMGWAARYHWRPDLYDEREEYLTQSGLGQATNAPRWFARHVDAAGDGQGLGQFEAGAEPAFTAGHDLAYFGALPEVGRDLGLTQMKLRLPAGYAQAETVVVALDCKRGDGSTETIEVAVPAGVHGPMEDDPVGEVVRVTPVDKGIAEGLGSPYAGSGFYAAVTDIRLVSGPEGAACRFTVVNDTPLLASAAGVVVEDKQPSHVALQIGAQESGPQVCDDGVGQVFLAFCREGEVWLTRRAGLAGAWELPKVLTEGQCSRDPNVEKDERGTLRLVWEQAGSTAVAESRDDGGAWEG